MKRMLLALVERLRVDLLDVSEAIEADDPDTAVEKMAEISRRIDAAAQELRA